LGGLDISAFYPLRFSCISVKASEAAVVVTAAPEEKEKTRRWKEEEEEEEDKVFSHEIERKLSLQNFFCHFKLTVLIQSHRSR
jgi:hypothetical protein